MMTMRESICCSIRPALLVLDLKLETKQFSEGTLLNWRVRTLIREVQEAFLVHADKKFIVLQIRMPVIDGKQQSEAFLFIH
jgi:hypothetical protein